MGEGAPTKGNAPASFASAEGPRLCADIPGSEVPDQLVDAADFEIPVEDQPHPFGLLLDYSEFAVGQLVAKGEGTAHPYALALGGCNLVPDTFGRDLALE